MIQTNLNFNYPSNIELNGLEATLERFANYPASAIKDEIISRLVREVRIQGRAFRTLTKVSLTQCQGTISRSTLDIIQTYEKFKTPNSSLNTLNGRQGLTTTELLKVCDLIRKGYSDISTSLQTISTDLQSHKSKIQKEQDSLAQSITCLKRDAEQEKKSAVKTGILVGFGIGSVSNATTVVAVPQFDCGLTLFATMLTGGLLGWYLGNKISIKLKHEAYLKEQQLGHLKENTKYIDDVMDNVKVFNYGVGLFEAFWGRQFDHTMATQEFISGVKKGNVQINSPTVESMLISWSQAKNALENYEAIVQSFVS